MTARPRTKVKEIIASLMTKVEVRDLFVSDVSMILTAMIVMPETIYEEEAAAEPTSLSLDYEVPLSLFRIKNF